MAIEHGACPILSWMFDVSSSLFDVSSSLFGEGST